ncbi:response regulator [Aureibaculum algae]|uniref:histidine kinase n=1 Tax=Aureibaculum algae TaxID=2584122 RepID=A0A5B7TRU6_9FLAO|nr:two-component regulator propeller domain-containing protein [Aureibaculum algae]QCX37322.1 response regulator [Aureibaculum algae]
MFTIALYTQTPRLDYFDISNGLSQNYVFSLDIDKQGNIWAGTLDGLNRFDGYDFEIFYPSANTSASIMGNIVTALHTDANGDIWISTSNGGLNKFDSKRKIFQHFYDSSVINYSTEGYNNINVTGNNYVWVQSYDKIGVYNKTANTFCNYQPKSVLRGLCPYKQNGVLSYGDQGVEELMYSDANVHVLKRMISEPVFWMENIGEFYYVALKEGIIRHDSSFQVVDTILPFKQIEKYFDANQIRAVAISKTNIWIGTTVGLYKFPLKEIQDEALMKQNTLENEHFINDDYISRLKFDKAGNLWIGTAKKGIAVYNKQKNLFNRIDFEKETIGDYDKGAISSLCQIRSGDLWISKDENGLTVLKQDGSTKFYTHYTDKNGRSQTLKSVRCIFEDSQNNIWLGTLNNVCRYNKNLDRIETLNYKFGWDWPYQCFVIKEFNEGEVTITGDNKIATCNLNTGNLDFLPNNHNGITLWSAIRDIKRDKHNNLWVAQNNYGLVKIAHSPLHFTRILKSNGGLSDNKVFSMEIQDDTLWLATIAGVDMLNTKTDSVFKSYSQEDGLSSNVVYSVHLDKTDNIWMSTKKGICKLNTKTDKITSYLHNEFYSDDAYFYDHDNTIYYSEYSGVTWFNPKEINEYNINTKPAIEDFSLFNQTINIGDTINSEVMLKDNFEYIDYISLNYKQNTFSLSFNAYPFEIPNNNKFRYRLVGIENDWIHPKVGIRTAYYTTISPGQYIFKVQVSSIENEWSDAAQVKIVIKPPFWQTIWFRIVFILFALALIAVFFQVRLARIKRIKLILEKRVKEQTKELEEQNIQILEISKKLHESDQAKLQFFTNISHEFRTPITLILGHLDNVAKLSNSKEVAIIKNNVNRLLKMVNQLIEVRKMDQGKLKLNVSTFDIVEFAKDITTSFNILAQQKELSLDFFTSLKKQKVWLDRNKTEQIFYNLISNAIKYTPNGRNIIVEVKTEDDNLIIRVENYGVGIPTDQLDKIFDRFYRLKNHKATGDGIGLALVKGLVELQKGEITAQSDVKELTSFILNFGLGKEQFSEEDFGENEIAQQLPIYPKVSNTNEANFEVGQKLLLVEDNIELIEYITNLLKPHFAIKTATNGKIALGILEEYMPDLIISDIMMPVMNGMEFCEKLKSKILTSHIPIILLTAKTDSETQIEGFRKGIDDYIEKPFNPDILLARINAILTRREQLKAQIIEAPTIEITAQSSYSKRDKEFWANLNQILEDNYSNVEFNVDELGRLLNMSKSTFYRKFTGLTGQSTSNYLRKFRLRKAAGFLYDDRLDIAEVCLRSGFNSLTQFRVNFKEEYGITPLAYRKRVLK